MYGRPQPDRPPQPEWRQPPRRPSGQQSEAPGPTPPPRPPTTGTYSPATYGPISTPTTNTGTSQLAGPGADPRTWGVRYNQQIHPIYAPPPLPPRPPSVNDTSQYTQPQPPPPPPPVNTSGSPKPSTLGVEAFSVPQSAPVSPSFPPPYSEHAAPNPTSPYAVSPILAPPPPPPKKPIGYQSNIAPQTSQTPERPPLLAQGVGPAATQGSYGFTGTSSGDYASGAAQAASTSSSALGPGTPSDWEHLGPTPGEFDDRPWFPPRDQLPQSQQDVASLNVPHSPHLISTPPGYSTGFGNASPSGPEDTPLSERVATGQVPSRNESHTVRPHGTDISSPISPASVQGIPQAQTLAQTNKLDSQVTSPGFCANTTLGAIDTPQRRSPPPVEPPKGNTLLQSPDPEDLIASGITIRGNSRPAEDPTIGLGHAQNPSQGDPARPATVTTRVADPYEDLDPWFKSSLARYVSMLRKEAVADTDEERFKIFTAFAAKETKLREILYNIEHDQPEKQAASSTPSVPRKDSPAVFESGEPALESGLIPVDSGEASSASTSATDDAQDVDDNASEYSAGGRPILGKQAHRASQWTPNLAALSSNDETSGRPATTSLNSLILDEGGPKQSIEPLTTNPPRPIYTPFQYTEGPQRGSDNLTFDRPAYQAYSELRQASAVSGRVLSGVPPSILRSLPGALSTRPSQVGDSETFVGLIRDRSTAYQPLDRKSDSPAPLLPGSIQQERKSDDLLEALRAMVLTPLDRQSQTSWHFTTWKELEKYPDNFEFVQAQIDVWESSMKQRRVQIEEARTARQEESEAHIDELFNEKAIGYADINTLEEDFRQDEARVQLDEEREEVESFVQKVFNPLDERLKSEIGALRKSYESALKQLKRDQKAPGSPLEQCSPSVTMRLINAIHAKLELRFQKRLELALDCERRRKKAERRPLVFIGDMAGLRKLDGEFDQMEKRNVLEAAKDLDDRANQLMDSFDEAILHGLGLNQSLLDELSSRTARLDRSILDSSGLSTAEIEHILKSTVTFANSLRQDSEAILHSSAIAEFVLNNADYNVSVAEAQYANSEAEVFERLELEKKKEDAILREDHQKKLQSIKSGPEALEVTVRHLLEDLEKTPRAASRTPSPDPTPAAASAPTSGQTVKRSSTASPGETGSRKVTPSRPPIDTLPLELRPAVALPSQNSVSTPSPTSQTTIDPEVEHKERLRRALEDAKRRNAVRSGK
ncbi:Uncharacterized protein PECH_001077 [Penicillium ucsense]|uniref:Uncharacterized protein n=1 Tax=Penicillium ucsense TaxID=2839758 RepID=A0A8J8W8D3_9EURO|nr:Uncharacterized protein PECM_002366 [Penicillium ucsense]KAF7738313.1 Uncharacterized protein PECH_001077 [Penicillium ucsense]